MNDINDGEAFFEMQRATMRKQVSFVESESFSRTFRVPRDAPIKAAQGNSNKNRSDGFAPRRSSFRGVREG